jgi:hypothetical protein
MTDGVFNYAKGRAVEKIADAAANVGLMLLKANEAEATLIDRTDLANLLAQGGNTEADFTNYARKTGITGTITVDTTNDWVDVDMPDQTWSSAGGASNNTLTKAVPFYEDSAADSGRIPLTHQDFAVTTNGNDLIANVNASGFLRVS